MAKSAAGQIWPHLQSDEPPKQQQPTQSLAASMWPSLVPKPKPEPNRYRASTDVSLAARCDENPWLEQQMELMGLRRKR